MKQKYVPLRYVGNSSKASPNIGNLAQNPTSHISSSPFSAARREPSTRRLPPRPAHRRTRPAPPPHETSAARPHGASATSAFRQHGAVPSGAARRTTLARPTTRHQRRPPHGASAISAVRPRACRRRSSVDLRPPFVRPPPSAVHLSISVRLSSSTASTTRSAGRSFAGILSTTNQIRFEQNLQ
ncbi:UNVERIFIED_CONTAM: hypothetical protein Sradi_2621800 [Sesamum radiatum]|uniref:Uncharacterized protein n=1 Tax=Sesamum radiatum TaxID=300843 RepID=A0AAW2S4B7_SESRA